MVNRSLAEINGGKSLADYQVLMAAAMMEMARVLKPGGWATVKRWRIRTRPFGATS